MSNVPFFRTVLGDIPAAEIGICYAHEHVVIDDSFTTRAYPDFLLNDPARISAELSAAYGAGVRCMIDTQPCGGGRNVLLLAEVSRRSRMHLVCPTGLHLEKYYAADHWGNTAEVSALAERFITDIVDGVDRFDYDGPALERTPHRAGIIKVAGGRDLLSNREKRAFAAAGLAQQATGAPIITHTEQGTAGMEQLDRLEAAGADLAHVVLSHCDRTPDIGYHVQLLERGATLEYDSGFRWPKGQGNPTRELIVALIDAFPDQIVLGMDAARTSYWKSYGGRPGLTWLIGDFADELRRSGVTDEQLHRIFVSTPARVYAFQKIT